MDILRQCALVPAVGIVICDCDYLSARIQSCPPIQKLLLSFTRLRNSAQIHTFDFSFQERYPTIQGSEVGVQGSWVGCLHLPLRGVGQEFRASIFKAENDS
jgi:hypothetical protein